MDINNKSLHLKILSGYIILGILVLGIITAVWYEKKVFEEAEKQEQEMLNQRKLANETFKCFIGLFLDNERAILWEHSDLEEYNRKQIRMYDAIQKFKNTYSDSLQIKRIDTIIQLLFDKKRQIQSLVNTPTTASLVDSLIIKQLPELEKRISSHTTIITNKTENDNKKTIFSWLKRRRQKESNNTIKTEIKTQVDAKQLHIIKKFSDDIYTTLLAQEKLFKTLSDTLEYRNKILNKNIFRLINEFEKEDILNAEKRHQKVSELREQAFILIFCISSVGLIFAILLYMTIRNDIHLRYKYQKQLEFSNHKNQELLEMRKRIIITLSHDIRGPLNAIRGSAELAMDTKDRKRRNSYLNNILSSTGHIMRLVNSLLDLSRLNEAKETLNEIPFRLNTFLSDIEKEYGRIANDKGIMLSGDFIGTDITVTGDADRIEQIISNLLSNAIKFTESGSIGFFAIFRNDILTVTVRDTGIGMSEETLKRIFSPFERAAVEICPEGFGLGLSITKGLVTLLKGNISVESKIGEGSTFKVSIPLKETSETIEEKCTTLPDPAKRLPHRIIVVEDDPVQMEITRDILERNGVSCHACQNVKEVVCLLRKEDYDLILTDIQMPRTNGFSLLNLLRNSNIGSSRSIPIAAMTARGDEEKENFIKAGFTGCIHKPFSSPELLLFLSSIMEKMNKPESQSIDFRPLISDSGNKRKVLTMLVKESETNKEELVEAIRNKDRMRIKEIIHRMFPMWEMLGIAEKLQEYRNLVHDDSSGDQVMKEWTLKITASLDRLVSAAENEINSLIRQENEKENTDS